MSVTQPQYDEIMREYERRREQSRHAAEDNKRIVRIKIPEYADIEQKITELAVASAERILDGDKTAADKMKKEMADLTARQTELLRLNGFADDYLTEKHACPDCGDTGYIDGKKCHCLRQALLRIAYRQSNIEDVLQRENFDTLSYDYYTDTEREKMKVVIGTCRRFADDFGSGYENLMLMGNVGSGKTFLTNCITKEILDRGYSVIYFTSIRLFDTLSREHFNRDQDDDGPRRVQRDIHSCDLLIIDDLGTENVNSFVAARLFDILNERDLRRKPTIISTNLSFEQLGDRYSERSISRILGSYTILRPDVEDLRIRKRRSEC